MSHQLFANDFSGYAGGRKKPVSKTMQKNFPTDMAKLERSTWTIHKMEATLAERIKSGLSENFIIYGKSTKIDGRNFLKDYEKWHVNDHLSLMHKKRSTVMSLVNQMHERLLKNPVGAITIPQDDELCYTPQQGVQVAGAPAVAPTSVGPATRSAAAASASATGTAPATPSLVNTAHF